MAATKLGPDDFRRSAESTAHASRFDGRTVVVAGAGGTLGPALCLRFLREGAHVVGYDRDPVGLDAVDARVPPDLRRRWSSRLCDVSDAAAVQAAIEHTIQARGQIDVLVNNAGVSGVVSVTEMSEQEWDQVLDINAKSVFLLCRAALPGMLARRSGVIISIASQAGKRAEPLAAHYCAAKAAVINFSRALALEVGPHLRVNTVCPGYIESGMTRADAVAAAERAGKSTEQLCDTRRRAIPLGRFQEPQDIAAAVCFLASDDARNITGVAFDVNGGETMN